VAARLTKVHQLNEVGSSGFLMAALAKGNEQTQCQALLEAGGLLPYGRLLDDDHHADCWRIAHQQRVYDNTERAREINVREPEAWTPMRVRKGPIF